MNQAAQWYLHHFLKGVCFHLPLVLLLIILFALPFNVFGEGIGVVQLIWSENLFDRFLVGAALGVVAVQALFVSYILWDRARTEGRLESDPGERSFAKFAINTICCLLPTLFALGGLWWLVGWLSGVDLDIGPDPITTDDPRPVWEKTAVPDPNAGWWARQVQLLMPLFGALAVFAVAGAVRLLKVGRWLANWQLVEGGRRRLRRLDRRLRGPDTTGRTWWRAAGVGIVLITWTLCPAAGTTHDTRILVVLTAFTMLSVLGFLACVFLDLWLPWPSHRIAACAFVLNLLVFMLALFLEVSFILSSYGFWPAVFATGAAAIALMGLAAALPGPAGEWLDGILLARALRARRAARAARAARPQTTTEIQVGPTGVRRVRPPDPLDVWPLVLAGGVLFFLPFHLFGALGSPAAAVCAFLFALVFAYGLVTVVVRRAVPVALTVLVFLAVLAGVERYKYRYEPDIEGMNYDKPLDLRASSEEDSRRQRAFEDALPDYAAATGRLKVAEQDYAVNEERRKLTFLDTFMLNWDETIQAERNVPQLLQNLREAQQNLEDQGDRLRGLWQMMEVNNRVLPPRFVRHDLGTAFLNRPTSRGGPSHDSRSRLLQPYDWQFREPQKGGPVIVIAVSGGGLRSAAWTFTVLRTLEEQFATAGIDFPLHVRIITGASGGMFGAAYYVTTLNQKRPVLDAALRKRSADESAAENVALRAANATLYEKLTRDHLTPLVQQHVFEDLPNLFSPWPSRNDRGKELERSWSRQLDGALDIPFADLKIDEQRGKVPSLVFTPMMIEDGRRLIVSNLDMRNALTNDGDLLLEGPGVDPRGSECHSRDALELFRLFPEASRKFKVSTAVRMSASFPFFSPAVSLPVTPRRRVVDAGYYDNYGVSLSAAWLISRGNRDWLMHNTSRLLLIQIRDGVDQPQRKLARIDPEGSTRLTRSTEEITSPFEGLMNARVGSSSFRNDNQLEILSQLFNKLQGEDTLRPEPVDRVFQVANFEFQEAAALSWYLSAAERKRVSEAMNKKVPEFDIDYPARIELLRRWMEGGLGANSLGYRKQ